MRVVKLFIGVLALTVVLGVLKYVNAFDFPWGAVFAPLVLYLISLACFLICVMIISLVSK